MFVLFTIFTDTDSSGTVKKNILHVYDIYIYFELSTILFELLKSIKNNKHIHVKIHYKIK